jgi:hypothetical protein
LNFSINQKGKIELFNPIPLALDRSMWHNIPMTRWILFFISVAIGIAAGLYYGWVINPVRYEDTTPDTLRADYKADFVLMTAEAYQKDGDLGAAARRLALLGDTRPQESVATAALFAAKAGYEETDLGLIQKLGEALQTWTPVPETATP